VKPLIFNATPLIYITKVGLSKILEDLRDEKLTSPQVMREVVDEGKNRGVPDAVLLEKMFQNNVFKVTEPKNQTFLTSLLRTKGLHITDVEVLALARESGGVAVIDDEVARKTARIYGITYVGTPYLLMRAIVQRLITKERAKQAINEMISEGWRCSIETYTKILDAIERLQSG